MNPLKKTHFKKEDNLEDWGFMTTQNWKLGEMQSQTDVRSDGSSVVIMAFNLGDVVFPLGGAEKYK